MKRNPHKVLVYLPAHVKSNRDLLQGILQFAEHDGSWEVEIIGIGERFELEGERDFSEFNGAIVYADNSKIFDKLIHRDIPVMVIYPDSTIHSAKGPGPRGSVTCSSRPIGEAAARFLLDSNSESYAFIGINPPTKWSVERRDTFLEAVRAANKPVRSFPVSNWEELDNAISVIADMPKPVAIFAENDRMSRKVLTVCAKHELSVPDIVKILGVDNDELICATANPPLSSIKMNALDTGARAARSLAIMLRSKKSSPRTLNYTFDAIIERTSTSDHKNFGALTDRVSEYIASRIREETVRPIRVNEIVQKLGVSRRSIEIDFRKRTGHTLHQEIVTQQLKKARQMLIERSLPLETISERCGFSSPSHFGAVFRERYGHTPSAERREHRK